MHVALLGGSFNPPHVGHLMAAVFVHATTSVDEVWLMPAFHHPFGKQLESFHHRVAMCEALTSEVSGWLKVTQVEREISKGGRTVDTLEHLVVSYPNSQFSLIIGSDILRDLPQWKDVERIKQLSHLMVLQRAGYPAPEAIGPPLVEVSSSQIRHALQKGETPSQLVPAGVLKYVQENQLYRQEG